MKAVDIVYYAIVLITKSHISTNKLVLTKSLSSIIVPHVSNANL